MSLKSLLEKNSLNFEDIFYKDCEVFVELLQKWGKVHNLSGRLSDDDIYENILDSLYPLNFIDEFNSFADIGTGAGYPGLILAIARKDVKSYLIEPRVKRVAFLNFVKASLGLNNLTILQKRAETAKWRRLQRDGRGDHAFAGKARPSDKHPMAGRRKADYSAKSGVLK